MWVDVMVDYGFVEFRSAGSTSRPLSENGLHIRNTYTLGSPVDIHGGRGVDNARGCAASDRADFRRVGSSRTAGSQTPELGRTE